MSLRRRALLASGCIDTAIIRGVPVATSNAIAVMTTAKALRTITVRHRPHIVIAELPTGASKSQKAARAMGMSVGTIVTFCGVGRLPLFPVSPLEVKRVVSTSGAVSKESVIRTAISIFGSSFLPSRKSQHEHVADAAIALIAFLKRKGITWRRTN